MRKSGNIADITGSSIVQWVALVLFASAHVPQFPSLRATIKREVLLTVTVTVNFRRDGIIQR